MRPVRLEIEGFTAFRTTTVIDFGGVELFALTGPTGSGKTSVLDAMVFALYGNVPRLADQRAVAPVIAQGMAEARVRLDFTVGGESYIATRVVRATKGGGASTAEARLERDGTVLAGTADEVTAAVTALLGLTYDHFTKCVVLPQGEFARFLHDKPRDRQELLVSLLDLGVYGRMAAAANQRAAKAAGEISVLDGRLTDLASATPDALAEATARVEQLTALVSELEAAAPALAALAEQAAAATADADAQAEAMHRLASVVVPDGLDALHDAIASAREAATAARTVVTDAEAIVANREAALAGLPDRAELLRLIEGHDRAANLRERLGKGGALREDRLVDLEAAQRALAAADEGAAQARAADDEAAAAHRAHAVRADLVPGEPCPVCLQAVTTVPSVDAPPVLEEARRARAAAEKAARAAAEAVQAATNELTKADTLLEKLRDDLHVEEAALRGAAQRDALEQQLAAVTAAAEDVRGGQEAVRAARRVHEAAVEDVQRLAGGEAAARDGFDAARDAVAPLGPPARLGAGAAVLDEWRALAVWAVTEQSSRALAIDEARTRASALHERREAELVALRKRCATAGVDVAGEEPSPAASHALGTATAHRDQLQQRVNAAATLVTERDAVNERRDVAKGLGSHLDAKHFEKWLLDEAMVALADGATELLQTLSGGQYSLRIDRKSGGFVVVDHRNADAVRSARTLSGGETFLTSLALALALADRIAALAAGSHAARLDAIFLDEGFGALDPDALDVVAGAIEELGASGRMVGVVSHVADLAERLPIRYEVQRVANASTIERVDR